MKEVTLRLKHHFDSAHHLNDYKGKCARIHGHRWNITVFARAIIKPNGLLIDFKEIKKEIDKLDHDDLNKIIDFNPTAENLANYFLTTFESIYPLVNFKVILYESPEASVEVRSDGWK